MIFFLILFTIIYGFSALVTGVYLVEREDIDATTAFVLIMIPVINTVVAVRVVVNTLAKFKFNNN